MLKLRPYLTAVLGLMLWVQGMAMAAVPVAVAQEPDSAMEMPCHGDEAPAADACACCDDACPDMASCVIGHFAGTPATALHFAAATQAALPAAGWSLQTFVPPTPLRPPIVTHA
jgi:hypothetical protein